MEGVLKEIRFKIVEPSCVSFPERAQVLELKTAGRMGGWGYGNIICSRWGKMKDRKKLAVLRTAEN